MILKQPLDIKPKEKIVHFSTYGMMLFFILLPFEYPLANFGVGSILRYAGVVAMGLALVDVCFVERINVKLDYRTLLLGIWIFFAVFSGMWAVDADGFSHYIGMYIRNAIMFLLISWVPFTKHEVKLMTQGFIIGIAVLLLYMMFFPGAVVYSDWQNRLTLAIDGEEGLDQNYLATLMSIGYGLVFYDVTDKRSVNFKQIIKLLFCIVCIYYIFLTGSRSGLLGVAIISVICFNLDLKKNIYIILGLLILFIFLIPNILEQLPKDLLERFSLDAMLGKTSESSSRLEIWRIALKTISESNWLVGNGAGATEHLIGIRYYKDAAVHNYLLGHILELGLIGVTLFTTLVYKMFKEVFFGPYRKQGVAFIGVIIASLFLDVLTTKFFWGAMMLLTMHISAISLELNN